MANKLFNRNETLYSGTGLTASANGTAKLITPSDYDELKQSEQDFRAVVVVTQTGGTSPTTDVSIQTSPDGTNWGTWVSATQVTGTASTQILAAASADLLKYVRAVVTLGGTAVATVACSVTLVSNAKYTLT